MRPGDILPGLYLSWLCQGKGPGRAELGSSRGWHGVHFPGEGQDAVLPLGSSLLMFFKEFPLGCIQTLHSLCPTPIKNWAATRLSQDFGCPPSTPTSHGSKHRVSPLGPGWHCCPKQGQLLLQSFSAEGEPNTSRLMRISAWSRQALGQGGSVPGPKSPHPQDTRQDVAHKPLPAAPADGILSLQTFCFLLPPQRQAKQQPQPFQQGQLCYSPSPVGRTNRDRYPPGRGRNLSTAPEGASKPGELAASPSPWGRKGQAQGSRAPAP